jgi:quinol monooxygenase YgiN
MVIVAGHITVEPQQRESYLAGCVSVVEQARGKAGCLDTHTDQPHSRRTT